jgi:thiamine transporter ThiT
METKKGFFKRWMEGLKNLSVKRQLEANIAFSWGNLIGFFGGFITMLIWVIFGKQYQYWWTAFILALVFAATIVQLVGLYQQKAAIIRAEDQMKQISEARLQ